MTSPLQTQQSEDTLPSASAFLAHPQHRPVAECEQEDGDDSNGKDKEIEDDDDDDDDVDEAADDQPPTISGNSRNTGNQKPRAQKQQPKKSNTDENGGMPVEGLATDAQLSCPLCFTTVCLECQRHAKYLNQFRAVTGINVNVKHDEFLTLDQVSGGGGGGSGRRKGGRKKRGKTATTRHNHGDGGVGAGNQPPEEEVGEGGQRAGEETEMFHPVSCGECDHIVGVYDAEEVFHFFGVIASG